MKILDRYVLWTFLKNYLISFMVLVGMYIVLDMVFHFEELVDVKGTGDSAGGGLFDTLYRIGDHYFYQVFLIFVYLSGMIPVAAAAFTLMRLSRFNELTAVLAAGVPLQRVALPVILAGVVLNLLLVADVELVVPRIVPKLMRDHDEQRDADTKSFEITNMQDDDLGLLRASKYTPATATAPAAMRWVDVRERREVDLEAAGPGGRRAARRVPAASGHLTADAATWNADEQRWDLDNGRRMTGLGPDDVGSAVEPVAFYKSSITPEEVMLYHNADAVELLSTAKINDLIRRPGSYGQTNLLRVKHWRFFQPIMNVILLLLTIPCVLTREPGKLKSAAARCLALTGVGMGAIFLSHQLAGRPPPRPGPEWAVLWPAAVAAAPGFVLGPLALLLFKRVKT